MNAAAPSAWRRVRDWLVEPNAPLLGLEIRRESVAALRLRRAQHTLDAAASVALDPGVLEPSSTQANVKDVPALTAAVRQVVERVGGLAERRVAVVLPDGVARLVFFDPFEPTESKGVSAADVVRFRLAERLRFDVRQADKVRFDLRQAEVAWHTWGGGPQTPRTAVVVAAPRAVLAEYEGVIKGCGLVPGQIEVASLALLRGMEAQRRSGDWLLVNWEPEYLTLFITRNGAPLLLRTLPSPVLPADLGQELASTLRYHRERLGGVALTGVLMRPGAAPVPEALALTGGSLSVTPIVVDPLAALGGTREDVAQALAAVGVGLLAGLQ